MRHITVLQTETVRTLNLKEGSVVVDCTLGSGGHARDLIAAVGTSGTYIGIDIDEAALASFQAFALGKNNVHLVNDNFRNINTVLEKIGVTTVSAVVADLGWRMEQFSSQEGELRGFSFNADEPLHMTFGSPSHYSFTATDIVNEWAEEDIANVIYAYGEERAARRVARAIVQARAKGTIETASDLASVIAAAYPRMHLKTKIYPATKTFQALRIAVNDELDALIELIQNGFPHLEVGGRMAIITFHSLEDRIVKHSFRGLTHDQKATLVTKRPITPSEEEVKQNPRARSAKLRVIERLLSI